MPASFRTMPPAQPHVPAVRASRVQQVPATAIRGNGQAVGGDDAQPQAPAAIASRVQQIPPASIKGDWQVVVEGGGVRPQVPSLLASSRGQQVPPACWTVPAGHLGVVQTPSRGLLPSGQVCDRPQVPVAMASGVQQPWRVRIRPASQI
jgi:hypothetical protein